MADLYNNFPSWGETGAFPQSGFFYEGGDQVNEKHMDALWNGIKTHIDNLNTGIRDRVRKLDGNVVLDQGLVASTGSGTREVDVTASSAGAFVDGQFSGSTSATTLTHTANGSGSTRTDVVWVNTDGTVGKTEGTSSPSSGRMKIAEVDVETDDTISAVRNYARDHVHNVASENAPSAEPGDIWTDLSAQRGKIRQNGGWRTLITEQDDITISGGDGLKGGNTIDLVGGGTLSLDIEPADFSGQGLEDDGADNLRISTAAAGDGLKGGSGSALAVEPADFAGSNLTDDGSDNLALVGTPQIVSFILDDRDGDGNNWQIVENGTSGHLEWLSNGAGGAMMDLEHDGTLRITGEITENASL